MMAAKTFSGVGQVIVIDCDDDKIERFAVGKRFAGVGKVGSKFRLVLTEKKLPKADEDVQRSVWEWITSQFKGGSITMSIGVTLTDLQNECLRLPN